MTFTHGEKTGNEKMSLPSLIIMMMVTGYSEEEIKEKLKEMKNEKNNN